MHAPDDNSAASRSGLRRLITPWEYRHLHAIACGRFAAGGFNLGLGAVLLSLGRSAETAPDQRKCYRWSTFFLALATLFFAGGFLDVIIDRSTPPRP